MHKSFPQYKEFDPIVPVWCVTPDAPGCMHRFFDTSPFSPSGRYLALFQLPVEDRQPKPGEKGNVCIVDLESGLQQVVAETCGWEPQMGANLNWGASDNELYFNDVDTATWRPFAWKLDPFSGERKKMEGSVYHASPDGKWLISSNLTTMRKTQPGYGVYVPENTVRPNRGSAEDDGFYLTDTTTGKTRLISIADLLAKADPSVGIDEPEQYEIYGFHSKFNPQGDKLMLSLRWFPVQDKPVWNMFRQNYDAIRFAWLTTGIEPDSPVCCAIGPEHFDKGGHHATWFPDGRRISLNLILDHEPFRFASVNWDGSDIRYIFDDIRGSGHPTVHPAGYIMTDTYNSEWDFPVYGDGTIPLRWVNIETGDEQTAIRINTQQPCKDGTLRVDPHPAWDRSWRYLAFNAYVGGTRRVFVADFETLISQKSVHVTSQAFLIQRRNASPCRI